MNNQLKNLYKKRWKCLLEHEIKGRIKAANPLLIKVNKDYEKAYLKIMIVGQETAGWNGELGGERTDIDFLMNDYDAYLNDKQEHFSSNDLYDSYDRECRLKRKYHRITCGEERVGSISFWDDRNFKYFKKVLDHKYCPNPDNKDKKVAFVWNNLSKIGNSKPSGKISKGIQALENSCFPVFEEEIKILQPNIIIFRCGNKRTPNISGYNSVEISVNNPVKEVKLDNFPGIFAIQTYHPNARKLGSENKNRVAKMIRKRHQEIWKLDDC